VFQNYLKRHWVRVLVSLLILLMFLMHTSQWHKWELIDRLDRIAYDVRLRLTMPETPDDRIVIVAIDEKSLAQQGRWPWPRDRMARLLDQLVDHYGVALVAFDVVFAEPEETSALALLDELGTNPAENDPLLQERYQQLRARFDHDATFVESLHGRNVVLGMFFTGKNESGGSQTAGALPTPLFPHGSFAGRRVPVPSGDGDPAKFAALQATGFGPGHLTVTPGV